MEQSSDLSQLLRLAQSGPGQELYALLRHSDGPALDRAMASASAGDYAGAMEALAAALSSPQAQALLKALEERP